MRYQKHRETIVWEKRQLLQIILGGGRISEVWGKVGWTEYAVYRKSIMIPPLNISGLWQQAMNPEAKQRKRNCLVLYAKTFRLSLVMGKYRRIFSNWGWVTWMKGESNGMTWSDSSWHMVKYSSESVSLPRKKWSGSLDQKYSVVQKEDSRIDHTKEMTGSCKEQLGSLFFNELERIRKTSHICLSIFLLSSTDPTSNFVATVKRKC